jgi:valyl-tRNA synthetase
MYEHQSNLEVRLAETRQFITTLEGRLANETYVSKAPAALVEESRAQLEAKKALVVRLQDELTVLS